MKMINNFVCASLLMTSLTAFNVPAAFAQDAKALSSVEMMDSESVIRDTFAKFTIAVNSDITNQELALRQAFSDAARSFNANKISKEALVEYAISDMNSAEARAFRAQVASLNSADLESEEGQALLQKILASQSKGSNFLPCGVGTAIAFTAGTGAFIMGILALANLGDATREERKQMDLDRAAIESEISILKAEGVSDNSYLVTSRKAELAQLEIAYQQKLDDKERNEKNTILYAEIAGGLALVAILGAVAEDCRY